jgi:small subunit ribosomal protein S17
MADEDVKGTSADAEVPDENQTEPTEVEKTPAESASADADVSEEPAEGTSADAEAPDEHVEVEVEVEAEAEGGADAQASGTSAEADVPKKRKRLPRRLRPRKTRPTRSRSTERKPIVRLETPEHERGRRQERQGLVVSDAMEKTIVVEVAVVKAHPRYKKVVRRTVKFHAHDERSEAKVGDLVKIVETRPLSRTKRWRLVEILEAAK